jgi:hypothetical protein
MIFMSGLMISWIGRIASVPKGLVVRLYRLNVILPVPKGLVLRYMPYYNPLFRLLLGQKI